MLSLEMMHCFLLGNLVLIRKVIKCKSKVKHINIPTLFSNPAHMLLIRHHVHVPHCVSLWLAVGSTT